MSPVETAELAVLLSGWSPEILSATQPFDDEALGEFWKHSQDLCRSRLATFETVARTRGSDTPPTHDVDSMITEACTLIGESFVADTLNRVWTGILIGSDRRRRSKLLEPVARNVFLAHEQVRNRALKMLVDSPGDFSCVDSIRRSMERWTDLLLGPIVAEFGLDELPFDPTRSREFSAELESIGRSHIETRIRLNLAGIRVACGRLIDTRLESNQTQARICSAMVRALPPSLVRACPQFLKFRNVGPTRTTSRQPVSAPERKISFAELRRRSRDNK